jgi:conjugative transfer signal peptidase TraF
MKRLALSLVGAAAIASSVVSTFIDLPIVAVWNASPSVPVGLYWLTPIDRLEVAQLVAVDPPDQLAHFIAERGYLPRGTPLLKRVTGLPGQIVCRHDQTITVDGVTIGRALESDSKGRPMPVWRGCRSIANSQIFLMNPDVGNSLDGRYFGLVPLSSVLGLAAPLWTEVGGTDRLQWQAKCSGQGQ